MIPKYKKKACGADRSKKKIYTPSECLIPKFENGFVIVHPQKRNSVRPLELKGFQRVDEVKKAKSTQKVKLVKTTKLEDASEKSELFEKSVKELRKIASKLDVDGRSSMKEAELVDAILEAKKSDA